MTTQEAGRIGGKKVAARYGKEYYKKIGAIGGKKGGLKVREKYGKDFFREIGTKGGNRVKELIEMGKQHESGE